MKISEAFSEYIREEIFALNKSAKTYESYKYSCSSFMRYFGDIKISKISPEMVEDYYLKRLQTCTSDTLRGQIMQLRAVLHFAQLRGIKTCDLTRIKIPKREKKVPRWLDRGEVELFIEDISTSKRGYSKINRVRNELLCRLLFTSGARISEICALNRDSIQNREFVAVGKSKCPRVCYISPEVERLIEEYLKLRTDDDPALFISLQTGRRMSPGTARDVFRRASRRSGITGVHPHTMRHSFATYMINQGVGIRDVCELLGHQNLDTTQKYTHITNPHLKMVHASVMR